MREVEVGDGELGRTIKDKLKWDVLKGKSPEFISSMVVKKLREAGYKITKQLDSYQITVVPVTQFPYDDPIQRSSTYVYEQYRGWEGEVIKERNNGTVDLVKVKIWKSKNTLPVITEILKSDLEYGIKGKKEGKF